MSKPNKISKAEGYRRDVFSAAYDMKGIVHGHGAPFARWLIDMIESGVDLPRRMADVLALYNEHVENELIFGYQDEDEDEEADTTNDVDERVIDLADSSELVSQLDHEDYVFEGVIPSRD